MTETNPNSHPLRDSGGMYFNRRLTVKINMMRSKTVIGAIIIALAHILRSGEFAEFNDGLQFALAVLEGFGVVLAGYGARHAIAKASQGVAQLHPFTVLAVFLLVSVQGPNAPASDLPVVTVDEFHGTAGDSLKYVLMWKQPADTVRKGKIDSTVYRIVSTKPITYYGSTGTVLNARRRKVATELADSFKLARPALGDSVTFQVSGFSLCRRGDCSVPGGAGWGHRETYAPPSATPTIRTETF